MKLIHLKIFLYLLSICEVFAIENTELLFRDLALVEEINKKQADRLPFFYNSSMVVGYFNMPSSRSPIEGQAGFGMIYLPPYSIYGLNFQYFPFIEAALNYRIYRNILDPVLGESGFGDFAERTANIKWVINPSQDLTSWLPIFAVGAEDFLGTKKFHSEYIVATKVFLDQNLELSIGWGRKRIKGFFGGLSWYPWRKKEYCIFKNLSFVAEYDGYNYQHHIDEHPEGKTVNTKINAGIIWKIGNYFQLNIHSVRGCCPAISAYFSFPFGTTKTILPKIQNTLLYQSPVDTEPLGPMRSSVCFLNELGYALNQQGLNLYEAYLKQEDHLWIKVINNQYREESIVRERLQRVLSAILPSSIKIVDVIIEADGILCQSYTFRKEDLYRYRLGEVNSYEFSILSPLRDPLKFPLNSTLLYKRAKDVWLVTLRPQFQTFFGSAKGKVKYNFSFLGNIEGYFLQDIYYEGQISYGLKSTTYEITDKDSLNPSQLINVRTDMVKYYPINKILLDSAYLQKSWNLYPGLFFRLSVGYFEPAYAGINAEVLYYPMGSNCALGLEQAVLRKRIPHSLKLSETIRRLEGCKPIYEPFRGSQYFLTLNYNFKPVGIDFIFKIGKFLANDYGVRFQVNRWFSSGLCVSVWYTLTNGQDRVNGQIYHDKGFVFSIPLDLFLSRSSRTYVSYKMSAWLRDIGGYVETGKGLYPTLSLERLR